MVDWGYLSLSEPSVVKKLIRTRSLVDEYYVAQRFANSTCPLSSDGGISFAEHILTTYIDLDSLIAGCGMTDEELGVISALMDGYCVSDITEELGYESYTSVVSRLDTAVMKITSENKSRWLKFIKKPKTRLQETF